MNRREFLGTLAAAAAAGVDFLLRGAKTARGNEYRQMVEDFELHSSRGAIRTFGRR